MMAAAAWLSTLPDPKQEQRKTNEEPNMASTDRFSI
jgi:hypothetical protein